MYIHVYVILFFMISLTVDGSWDLLVTTLHRMIIILLLESRSELKVCLLYFLGETFVTRKITRAVAKIHLGLQENVSTATVIYRYIAVYSLRE